MTYLSLREMKRRSNPDMPERLNSRGITSYFIPMLALLFLLILSNCSSDSKPTPSWEWGASSEFGKLPRWSPDGSRIVFGDDRLGSAGIYIWDTTSDPIRVVNSLHNWDYRWSPDGAWICWTTATAPQDTTSGLWIMNLESREAIRLHHTGRDPSWKHDGSSVIFRLDQGLDSDPGIYEVSVESNKLRFITSGYKPYASPSGEYIAFTDSEIRGFLKIGHTEGPYTTLESIGASQWEWAQNAPMLSLIINDDSGALIKGMLWKVVFLNESDVRSDTLAGWCANPSINGDGSKISFQRTSGAAWAGVWIYEEGKESRVSMTGRNPNFHPSRDIIAINDVDGGIRILRKG